MARKPARGITETSDETPRWRDLANVRREERTTMIGTTEYDRRGPHDRAEIENRASERARLTGIPHYILANACESWVAGHGARNEFWASLPALATFNARGERT